MSSCVDTLIVGGGFYGSLIALHLAGRGERVLLVEREPDLLRRASYHNQARVHHGYHYPRSFVTALRSRINFHRFSQRFEDCIDSSFAKYYAVGRQFSKVTAQYFETFYRRLGAPIDRAPPTIRALFSSDLVEEVFAVEETAFNADRLRSHVAEQLQSERVRVRLNTEAWTVTAAADGQLQVLLSSPSGTDQVRARRLINCTYSRINALLQRSGLPLISFKHELTEMALIDVPPLLKEFGITLMCGPFFSCMPFPPRGLHTLSHVRYTPHTAWQEGPGRPGWADSADVAGDHVSNYGAMIRDAQRYLPLLGQSRYVDSLWEIKTVLPVSEQDDSRPILFKPDWGLPNLHCVMGAKIDNVFDVLDELDRLDAVTPAVRKAA